MRGREILKPPKMLPTVQFIILLFFVKKMLFSNPRNNARNASKNLSTEQQDTSDEWGKIFN